MPSSSLTGKNGMPLKDPYQLLGIPYTALEADVKRAYCQLALSLHLDKQSCTFITDFKCTDLNKGHKIWTPSTPMHGGGMKPTWYPSAENFSW
jgi:hypothetical protein